MKSIAMCPPSFSTTGAPMNASHTITNFATSSVQGRELFRTKRKKTPRATMTVIAATRTMTP